ncbi:SUKH-4 family immunity protein [Streptomyces sp. NPDC046859]|uniref:SUKH-4 family immunity protein n=1 Tax=Streptomyces sp. NPDC046859 TaxID=3155734 RepID=UPI0033CB7E1C
MSDSAPAAERLAPDQVVARVRNRWGDGAPKKRHRGNGLDRGPGPPAETGPFFQIGLWPGAELVIDGPTGHILRMPRSTNESGLDDYLVATDLDRFLAMVTWWITGHRILNTIENQDEEHLFRQHLEDAVWIIDKAGSQAQIWTYPLQRLIRRFGAVVHDYTTGYDSWTLATGLRQFRILVRPYHALLTGSLHTPAEHIAARRGLRQWADDIDPATEDADQWEQVFEGDLDFWGTE